MLLSVIGCVTTQRYIRYTQQSGLHLEFWECPQVLVSWDWFVAHGNISMYQRPGLHWIWKKSLQMQKKKEQVGKPHATLRANK